MTPFSDRKRFLTPFSQKVPDTFFTDTFFTFDTVFTFFLRAASGPGSAATGWAAAVWAGFLRAPVSQSLWLKWHLKLPTFTTHHCYEERALTMAKVTKLRDVFGVGRDMPLNYVARPEVDDKLIKSLTRDKHVVIYGSSKQGKTTLRKHCLDDDDYIVVSCLNSMNLSDLHGAILKTAGYRIEQIETKTVGGNWKYGVEFKGEGKVPLVATASGAACIERDNSQDTEIQTARLEIDLAM